MRTDDVLRAMDKLAREEPTTEEEWADWWFRNGELHGRYAAQRGEGWGSACHGYTQAARRFAALGMDDKAEQATRLASNTARLAARR